MPRRRSSPVARRGRRSPSPQGRRAAQPAQDPCDQWRANPLVNPRTNRRITRDGPTFQALQRECGQQPAAQRVRRSPSPQARRRSPRRAAQPAAARAQSPCDQWRANPLVNPRSNRRIMRDGPVYRELQRECGQPAEGSIAAAANQVQNRMRDNMEQVAHILISRGPLTIRQLNSAAREVGLTPDNVNDALFTLTTRRLVVREGNIIIWLLREQEPAAALRLAAAGPDIGIRTKLGLHPRLSRTEKLSDLKEECSDMSDPITIEDFEDMSEDELASVVKIGERPPKHCYTLSNIRGHIRNQRDRNLPVKDPMNPGYRIPDRDINEILREN